MLRCKVSAIEARLGTIHRESGVCAPRSTAAMLGPPWLKPSAPPPRAEHGRKILNRQAGHWVHLILPRLSLQCAESRGAGCSGRGTLAQVEEEQSSGSRLPGTIQVEVSSGSHLCHPIRARPPANACVSTLVGRQALHLSSLGCQVPLVRMHIADAKANPSANASHKTSQKGAPCDSPNRRGRSTGLQDLRAGMRKFGR